MNKMIVTCGVMIDLVTETMKARICILLLGVLFLDSGIHAQNPFMQIGEWRIHLPYNTGIYVTQSQNDVYYITPISLLKRNKATGEITTFNTINGLTGVSPNLCAYNNSTNKLLLCYSDGNMDVLDQNDRVTNVNLLLKNPNIIGSKKINHISFKDKIAYLSCSFGIVELNMQTLGFGTTVFTDIQVNSTIPLQDKFYACTEEGIYHIDNLAYFQDFTKWELLEESLGFPASYRSRSGFSKFNRLWFDVNDTLYQFDGVQADSFAFYPTFYPRYLTGDGVHLIAGFYPKNPGESGVALIINDDLSYNKFDQTYGVQRTLYGIEDQNGRFWWADEWFAFRSFDPVPWKPYREVFAGPYSAHSSQLLTDNNKVYAATGGLFDNETVNASADGMMYYDGNEWKTVNRIVFPQLWGKSDLAYHCVLRHPETGKVYIGTVWGGLLEFDETANTIQVYDASNSGLHTAEGDVLRTRVTSLDFDSENNMWICNHGATQPIACWLKDGSWASFNCSSGRILKVKVDRNNYKWIAFGNFGGLLVFDSGTDIKNPLDDRYFTLNNQNSNLSSDQINTMEEDLDGSMWVGTDDGIVIFNCGDNVFKGTCKGDRRIVNYNGFNAYLLSGEKVTAIAIDGANRKWIGTTHGVFHLSADGEQQLAVFNTQNSPLPSNIITSISINKSSGEVWIGTENGIVTYKGDAIEGGERHTTITAFPNPVPVNYSGNIAIKGLATDATIRITDVGGRLVYETKSLGGQAIWNGMDYKGQKVAGGVYLIFSIAGDVFSGNPDQAAGKLLIRN